MHGVATVTAQKKQPASHSNTDMPSWSLLKTPLKTLVSVMIPSQPFPTILLLPSRRPTESARITTTTTRIQILSIPFLWIKTPSHLYLERCRRPPPTPTSTVLLEAGITIIPPGPTDGVSRRIPLPPLSPLTTIINPHQVGETTSSSRRRRRAASLQALYQVRSRAGSLQRPHRRLRADPPSVGTQPCPNSTKRMLKWPGRRQKVFALSKSGGGRRNSRRRLT